MGEITHTGLCEDIATGDPASGIRWDVKMDPGLDIKKSKSPQIYRRHQEYDELHQLDFQE